MRRLIILASFAGFLTAGYIYAASLPAPSSNNPGSNKSKHISNDTQDKAIYPPNSAVEPASGAEIRRIENVKPKANTNQGENKTKSDDSNDFGRWPPTSGWAIAYITIAYVIVSFVQLYAIWRQANITRQAMTTAERAWVGVGFDRPYILGADCIDLQIFNCGKSVGNIKDIQLFGFEAVDKNTPIPTNPKSVHAPGMGTWTIFPGESTIQKWDVRLNSENISEVAAKNKLLPIHGFVRYSDIFGNEHITKFYRVWMEDKGALDGIFAIPPDAAPGQNEAT